MGLSAIDGYPHDRYRLWYRNFPEDPWTLSHGWGDPSPDPKDLYPGSEKLLSMAMETLIARGDPNHVTALEEM